MIVIKTLGYLANLPTMLAGMLFYVLPLQIFGQLTHSRYRPKGERTAITHWYETVEGSWFEKKFPYGGMAIGPLVVLKRELTTGQRTRIMDHEETHVIQGAIQGTLWPVLYVIIVLAADWPLRTLLGVIPLALSTQPICYILSSVFIWIFLRKRHAYYDNPYERQARARAGQNVEVPPSGWRDGPDDRWLWW